VFATPEKDLTTLNFIVPGRLSVIPCNCLLDSGATRTHEFATTHNLCLRPCSPYTVHTTAGTVTIQQETHALLTLGSHDQVFEITAFVLPPADLPAEDVLLGSDWLTRNSVKLYYDRRKCTIGRKPHQTTIRVPDTSTNNSAQPNPMLHMLQQAAGEPTHTPRSHFIIGRKHASKLVKNGASYFLVLVHSPDTAPSQCPLAEIPALSEPCQSGYRGLAMAAQAVPPDPSTFPQFHPQIFQSALKRCCANMKHALNH
jgi:hypothetical protein